MNLSRIKRSANSQKGAIAQLLLLAVLIGGVIVGTYLIGQRTNLLPKANVSEPVSPRFVRVISPNGGETFRVGETVRITWHAGGVDTFDLGYVTADGKNKTFLALHKTSDYYYDWVVAREDINNQIRIRLFGHNQNTPSLDFRDESNGFFRVIADEDRDGFSDEDERKLRTDVNDACPDNLRDDAWPPDLNNDKVINGADISVLTNNLGRPAQGNRSRYDLNLDGKLNALDSEVLKKYTSQSCQN